MKNDEINLNINKICEFSHDIGLEKKIFCFITVLYRMNYAVQNIMGSFNKKLVIIQTLLNYFYDCKIIYERIVEEVIKFK